MAAALSITYIFTENMFTPLIVPTLIQCLILLLGGTLIANKQFIHMVLGVYTLDLISIYFKEMRSKSFGFV